MNVSEFLDNNLLCKMLAGSHSYGTNIATSDVDYRGLFFAPPEYIRTPFFATKEAVDQTEEDSKYYELSQFMKLYTAANPNIIELGFVDRQHIEITSDPYEHFRANAHKLLSKKVAFTFTGYAVSQLKRVKGHNKWINNPQPEEAPQQIEYIKLIQNFTEEKKFKIDMSQLCEGWKLIQYGGNIYGLYRTDDKRVTSYNREVGSLNPYAPLAGEDPYTTTSGERVFPSYVVQFNKEQYTTDRDQWKNYWTWKRNRNESRAELEASHGFDTKHGMHLIRLLRMGEEILTTGEVNVFRKDADELLTIRNGEWTYDQLVNYAEARDKLIRNELYQKSELPHAPDLKYAAQLTMELQDMCWSGQINRRSTITPTE